MLPLCRSTPTLNGYDGGSWGAGAPELEQPNALTCVSPARTNTPRVRGAIGPIFRLFPILGSLKHGVFS